MSSAPFSRQRELRPGKGKGPWDGLGATAKTKVRNDITNGKCLTPSGRIRSALEVAQHLRATFATSEWLMKHTHMKINEIVVFYIDKDEKEDTGFPRINWPTVDPKYSTLKDISKRYCFMMRGKGRAASRRFTCWCEACCLAHHAGASHLLRHCRSLHLAPPWLIGPAGSSAQWRLAALSVVCVCILLHSSGAAGALDKVDS